MVFIIPYTVQKINSIYLPPGIRKDVNMQDSIYTIPVSEVFDPKCGCPICAMRNMLENRCIEYIMGAAMMEPDVRIETNKTGFCKEHFTG